MLVDFPSFSIFWNNLCKSTDNSLLQNLAELACKTSRVSKKQKLKTKRFPFAAEVPPLSGDFSGEMNQHKYLKPSARGAKGTDSNSSQL